MRLAAVNTHSHQKQIRHFDVEGKPKILCSIMKCRFCGLAAFLSCGISILIWDRSTRRRLLAELIEWNGSELTAFFSGWQIIYNISQINQISYRHNVSVRTAVHNSIRSWLDRLNWYRFFFAAWHFISVHLTTANYEWNLIDSMVSIERLMTWKKQHDKLSFVQWMGIDKIHS